jgi:PAS domain S-box-containing protein
MSYTETEASSEELNRQKKLLQAILDSSDVGSVLLSPERKVLFFNKTTHKDILQLWGKEICIGEDFLPYVAPSLKSEFEKEFQKAIQGQIIHTEREITDSKGNKVWLRGKYLPVYGMNNELIGVNFTIENIDQRKRTLALFRKSEKMLAESFGAIPVALAITNFANGEIVEVNKAWLELLDFDYENVIGKTHVELTIVDEQTRLALREKIMFNKFDSNIEITIRTSKGTPKTVIAFLEKYEIGGVLYILYTLIDISQRKVLENNIFAEKQKLINIIRSTEVGTWEWSIQTREVKRNEQWAGILGYTLDELQPLSLETWEQHVHPDDLANAKELLSQHLSGKTEIYECELRMKHKDGHWIWILDKGKVLEWDPAGKPLKMYGMHQDITAQKLLEKQLQERNEMLANTEEELR